MQYLNSRDDYDKKGCCCDKCQNSYKKIECFKCHCHKIDLCDDKRPGNYKVEKQMEGFEVE